MRNRCLQQFVLICLVIALVPISYADEFSWLFEDHEDYAAGTYINTQSINDYLELSSDLDTLRYLWVANAAESSVSKIDTVIHEEVARYYTGPGDSSGGHSPSRTAVDSYGNVWVGNRLGERSAVKIAGHISYCVDRNGNSMIDTSHEVNGIAGIQTSEMLTWGEDECVLLWPDLTDSGDRGPRAVAIDLNGYAWVGLYNDQEVVKLDPNTGAELARLSVNGHPYGAAIDGNGFLWTSNRGGNTISKIDTNTDTVVFPGVTVNQDNIYGIAIDAHERIWLGLMGHSPGRGLMQIDTNDPTQQTWHDIGTRARGVTVDFNGNVWFADSSENRVYKVIPDSDTYPTTVTVACQSNYVGNQPIGVVTDSQGYIWVMARGDDIATKIDPSDCSTIATVATGDGPYTYSDATGSLLNQFIRLGTWTITLTSPDPYIWHEISWTEWDNPEDNILVEKRTLEETSFTPISSGESFFNVSTGFVIRITLQRNNDSSSPKLDDFLINATSPMVCIDNGTIDMEDRTVEFNYSSYPGHEYHLIGMITDPAELPCDISELDWDISSSVNFMITGPGSFHNITIVPDDPDWSRATSETLDVEVSCEGPACYNVTSGSLIRQGDADVVLITDFSGSMKKSVSATLDESSQGNGNSDCEVILSAANARKSHLARCVDAELINVVLNYTGNRIWPVFMHNNEIDTYAGDPSNLADVEDYVLTYGPQGDEKTCLACALNRAYEILESESSDDRHKFIVMMTDGVPTHCASGGCTGTSAVYGTEMCIGFCDANGQNTCDVYDGCNDALCSEPESNTLNSAQNNVDDLDTKIYTIGFGIVEQCTRADALLSQIASIGGGEYHHSMETQELRQIYIDIARSIVEESQITEIVEGPIAVFTGSAELELIYSISPDCGNGFVDPGEECDDGPSGSNLCTPWCNWTRCGDGITQDPNARGESEDCDDGNTAEDDFCDNSCREICKEATWSTIEGMPFEEIDLWTYVEDDMWPPPEIPLTLSAVGADLVDLTWGPNSVLATPWPGFLGGDWDDINITLTDGSEDATICFNFTVENITHYLMDDPEETRLLVAKGKMVSGFYEKHLTGNITSWGPYIITIKVWEKKG